MPSGETNSLFEISYANVGLTTLDWLLNVPNRVGSIPRSWIADTLKNALCNGISSCTTLKSASSWLNAFGTKL